MSKLRANVEVISTQPVTSIKRDGRHREPMVSAQEFACMLGMHYTNLSHMITAGIAPEPTMYTGKRHRAYWHKSVAEKFAKEWNRDHPRTTA